MRLSHTFQIKKLARQGKTAEEILKALRLPCTVEVIASFMPVTEEIEASDVLTPAEKGKRTKAANKAKASHFE